MGERDAWNNGKLRKGVKRGRGRVIKGTRRGIWSKKRVGKEMESGRVKGDTKKSEKKRVRTEKISRN